MTTYQHAWDVIVKSTKTALEVYAAFVGAGALNIINASITLQSKIAGLAFIAAGLFNAGLKVHAVVTAPKDQTSPTEASSTPEISSVSVPAPTQGEQGSGNPQ